MNVDFKKFAITFLIPALLIYAAVVVFPPILTPYLGAIGGTYTGALVSIISIIGALWFYRRFVSKGSLS